MSVFELAGIEVSDLLFQKGLPHVIWVVLWVVPDRKRKARSCRHNTAVSRSDGKSRLFFIAACEWLGTQEQRLRTAAIAMAEMPHNAWPRDCLSSGGMAHIVDHMAKRTLPFPSIYHAHQNVHYEEIEGEQNHQGAELIQQRHLLFTPTFSVIGAPEVDIASIGFRQLVGVENNGSFGLREFLRLGLHLSYGQSVLPPEN